MLLRAVGKHISPVVRLKLSVRSMTLTRVALGGGGHHHEPLPVYIPKPGSLSWSLCGNPNAKPIHPQEPYKPDLGAFVGAAVFIGLTFAAVFFKTDVFKKEKPHHHGHHSKPSAHKEDHSEKPEEKLTTPKIEETTEKSQPEKLTTPKIEETTEKPQPEKHVSAQSNSAAAEGSSSSTLEHVSAQSDSAAVEVPSPSSLKGKTDEATSPSTSTDSSAGTKTIEHEESEPSTAASSTKPADEPTTSESKRENSSLHCEYVIVGSGTAAYYASLAIRAKQAEAKVLMIGEELELPYNRPPLSKELWWYGDDTSSTKLDYTSLSGKKRDIFYEVDGFFVSPEDIRKAVHGGVSLIRGKKAVKICAADKKVILEDGTTIGYDKILIATGIRPKKEKVFEDASEEAKQKITYYHCPEDFKRVSRGLADKSIQKVTVIGNGLLASELSYSIKRKYGENVEVHQVFEQTYPADDLLPTHMAEKACDAIRQSGIDIRAQKKVESVRKCCKNVVLKLSDGSELRTDLIVVATGEEPNSDIIEASGLKIDEKLGGVKTDKYLKVAENVWAAGAVAAFEDGVLGARRVTSWENAQISGRLAGENMATSGKSEKAFWYQPSFFTKFASHFHINAVGQCDSSLETVTVHAEPDNESPLEKAVVFYKSKEDGSIVGVLLLNVFGPSLDVARRIIDDRKKVDEYKEVAKLFPLYDPPKVEEETKEKSP